jgi:hypothetical protein
VGGELFKEGLAGKGGGEGSCVCFEGGGWRAGPRWGRQLIDGGVGRAADQALLIMCSASHCQDPSPDRCTPAAACAAAAAL